MSGAVTEAALEPNTNFGVLLSNIKVVPPFKEKVSEFMVRDEPDWCIILSLSNAVLKCPLVYQKLLSLIWIPSREFLTLVPIVTWFDKSVLTWSIPVIEPVVAVIAPCKKHFL